MAKTYGRKNEYSVIGFYIYFLLLFFPDQDALLEYESHRRRIFLRRLSGSELGSTSFLLGNGSSNESRSRLVLRPLSVQERIRELNLRARHFAETVMAVQLHDTVSVGKIV